MAVLIHLVCVSVPTAEVKVNTGGTQELAVHVLMLESKQVPAGPVGNTVIATLAPAVSPETVTV